jgi:hypothetical protein
VYILWFVASLEIKVDGRGSLAVLVFGNGFVLAAVAVFYIGDLQPRHEVQLLVLLQADFKASTLFHGLRSMEPEVRAEFINTKITFMGNISED